MRPALDTNVLVYALDRLDTVKRARAQLVWDRARALGMILPLQVVNELFNVLRTRRDWDTAKARAAVTLLLDNHLVVEATTTHTHMAMRLTELHRLQFWDALVVVVSAAHCATVLLSEDGQDRRYFTAEDTGSNPIRLLNPFAAANEGELAGLGLL